MQSSYQATAITVNNSTQVNDDSSPETVQEINPADGTIQNIYITHEPTFLIEETKSFTHEGDSFTHPEPIDPEIDEAVNKAIYGKILG